jgi:phosphate-selective porin OprO and OprP
MKRRPIALAAAALSVAWCSSSWADETSEKALEKKLEQMQKQIDEMSRRLSDGSNRSDDELEQRVAEIEKITKKDQDGLFSYWKSGLKLDSVDGAFKLSIFGRVQLDFTSFDRDDDNEAALGDMKFGTEFRRVRIGAGGTIYRNVEYKAEFDFADSGTGAANFADVYMQLNGVGGQPVNVRVGHFDEPLSLERVTSSKYTTFTERSLVEGSGFAPGRNTGAMVYGQALANHLAWFLGAFRDTNAFGNYVSPARPGENNVTARVAGRPWISEDGVDWVHLGAAVSRRNPNAETVQFRARPEVHVGPRFVDTGAIATAKRNTVWDLESAVNLGSFHAQAEMARAMIDGTEGDDDVAFQAESIQVGYFLTGDYRDYDAPMARWNRLKMKKNYGADGWGAFEIAARWSHVDLNDGDVEGGKMTDWTVGINWYLNPNTKVMLDWIHFNPDREVTKSGKTYDLKSGDALVMSFRLDF